MTVKQGWTGRVFEDFEVGDVYQHPLGRTVIAADNPPIVVATSRSMARRTLIRCWPALAADTALEVAITVMSPVI